MLKYILIVTLFNVKIISGEEDDDDAFVNSLPIEQKNEFLKTVVEKIDKEVQVQNNSQRHETDIDLIEKHLEDQGKLVKEIVRKEIDSLKRRMNQPPQQNREKFVDLTLRSSKIETIHQGERKTKPKDDPNESKYTARIPVAVNYDTNSSKGKREISNKSSDVNDSEKLASNQLKIGENTSIPTTEIHVNKARRSGDVITFDDIKTENNDVSESTVSAAETTTKIVDVISHKTTTKSVDVTSHEITTKSVNVTSQDVVNSTLQGTVETEPNTKSNSDESTIDVVATSTSSNKHSTTTQGNNADNPGAIDSTTLSYADTSLKPIISAINTEKPKLNSKISLQTDVNVTASSVTTQQYITVEIAINPTNDIDNTTVSNDIVSTTLHDLITTPHIVNNSKTPNITTNNQSAHVTSRPNTTKHTTSETGHFKSTNDIDNTTESNDGISTIPHDSITKPYTVNNSKTLNTTTTNNYNDTTTTSPYQTTLVIQRDDLPYTKEPTEPTTHSRSVEVNENQPLFVPVHNYNPENAYFNTFNNQGPNGNNDKQIISQNTSTVLKNIENHTESDTLDSHSLFVSENKSDLRIKDIKGNKTAATSNTEIEIDADDIMSSGEIHTMFNSKTKSYTESRADIPDEKPLKYKLNKIREIMFRHNISFDNMEDDRSDPNVISKKLEVGFGFPQKDRVTTNPTQFNTFGSLLMGLIDHADDPRHIESKPKIDEASDSDTDTYNDVITSLKKHNAKLQNRNLHQTIKTLENLNRMKKKQLRIMMPPKEKQGSIDSNKTRFQIKYRDGHKPNRNTLEQDISIIDYIDILAKGKAKMKKDKRNKPKTLRIGDEYLRLHTNILRDLVEQNDPALQKYDWLTTTVNIQAAIAKLQGIIENERQDKVIHHLDHRLLKLVTNLYKNSINAVRERNNHRPTRKYFQQRFKAKKGKMRIHFGKRARYFDIEDFTRSLDCLKNCLNDLHTAIKQISLVTTYKNQHWFQNLKQLYLKSGNEKEYLELLLHLTSARLFGLLEDTATTIFAEDGDFLKKNPAESDRIGVEFVMVIKICNELMQLND